MEKGKIPFSSSKLRSLTEGKYKLVTRDGREAKILGFIKGEPSVVFSVPLDEERESVYVVRSSDGTLDGHPSDIDLFLVPTVKKLDEVLDQVVRRFINDPNIAYSERDFVSTHIVPYVEELRKSVPHSLRLSKSEKDLLRFYLDDCDYKHDDWSQSEVVEMREKFRKWVENFLSENE